MSFEILIDQAPREETWEQFVDSLPAYEPRFIVYDFEFTDSERRKHADLLLITWYVFLRVLDEQDS